MEIIDQPTETFYVTFGVQYTQENPHPLGFTGSGWLSIEAPDMEIARGIANGLLGQQYAFIYDAESFFSDPRQVEQWYPDGELLRLMWVSRGLVDNLFDAAREGTQWPAHNVVEDSKKEFGG